MSESTQNLSDVAVVASAPEQKVSWEQVKAQHFTENAQLEAWEKDSKRDPRTQRLVTSPLGPDYDPKKPDDEQTVVKFTRERVFSALETTKTGEPTYIVKEFVTVIPPKGKASKQNLTVHTIATPFYQWRFPKEYKDFLEGKQTFGTKTPLVQWSALQTNAAAIEEMAQVGIKTVEDLVSTSNFEGARYVKNFGDLKEKAKAFIRDKNKPQDVVDIENKLLDQQQKHEAEIKALTEQVSQLVSLIAKQQAGKAEPKAKRAKGTNGKFQKRETTDVASE